MKATCCTSAFSSDTTNEIALFTLDRPYPTSCTYDQHLIGKLYEGLGLRGSSDPKLMKALQYYSMYVNYKVDSGTDDEI
jgi:hypothetical protein